MSANDGGRAFPRPATLNTFGQQDGMTLRQWYAGMVLAGMIANGGEFMSGKEREGTRVAFRHADAMIQHEAFEAVGRDRTDE